MVPGLTLYALSFDPVAHLVAAASAAHRALDSAAVTIRVTSREPFSTGQVRYRLAYDRSRGADLSILRAHPLRVVLEGQRLTVFDPATRQYTRSVTQEGSLGQGLRRGAVVLDDLVAALPDREGIAGWVRLFLTGTGWQVSAREGLLWLERKVGSQQVVVGLERGSHRVRAAALTTGPYGTEWELEYSEPAVMSPFHPPAGSYETKLLRPSVAPPAYDSPLAKAVTERLIARYEVRRALAYEATQNGDKATVWILDGSAGQEDGAAQWTVAGNSLTLWDKRRGLIATGPASFAKVVDAVAKSGSRIEPLLREMLRGVNPFRVFLGEAGRVRVTGSVNVNGEPCSLLESRSALSELAMVVRDRDGFVLSLSTIPHGGAPGGEARTFHPLDPRSVKKTGPPSGLRKVALDQYLGS